MSRDLEFTPLFLQIGTRSRHSLAGESTKSHGKSSISPLSSALRAGRYGIFFCGTGSGALIPAEAGHFLDEVAQPSVGGLSESQALEAPFLGGSRRFPVREDDCPIAAGVSPVRPDGSPQRGDGSPKAADGSPHGLGGSPNRADGSPNQKTGSPKSPGGSPKARFVSPIHADRSPRAARQLKRFPDLFERFRRRVERLRRGLERFRGGLDLRRELSEWFWDRVLRLHAGREWSGGRRGTLPGLA
jgi:hypothetical protein